MCEPLPHSMGLQCLERRCQERLRNVGVQIATTRTTEAPTQQERAEQRKSLRRERLHLTARQGAVEPMRGDDGGDDDDDDNDVNTTTTSTTLTCYLKTLMLASRQASLCVADAFQGAERSGLTLDRRNQQRARERVAERPSPHADGYNASSNDELAELDG